MIKSVINIILILFCCTNFLSAQDELSRQLNFADNLFEEGLYFDAITEYKRLLFFDENKKYDFDINYKIAVCYKKGAKFDESIKYFSLAALSAQNEEDKFEINLQIVRLNILRKTTGRSLQLLNDLETKSNYSQKKEINYWRGWTYMFDDKWDSAAVYFNMVDYDHELKNIANRVENDKYSVTFAKVISYILPGSGQFYTGNYLSGIMSLGWTAIWGYLTADAFIDERVFDGFAIGDLLFLRFYRGNIQNAEKFAVQENIKISNKALRYLQNNYKGIKP
ncbi:MAG: hypothetical protein KJ571_06140 [Bacteroidetes bacterium]|nr:hypothetical protein [Bacteroidota bacterium]